MYAQFKELVAGIFKIVIVSGLINETEDPFL